MDYFTSLFGTNVGTDVATATRGETSSTSKNILVRKRVENASLKCGYKNPETNSIYGVGSGAGYIELGNGTYTVYREETNFTNVYTGN